MGAREEILRLFRNRSGAYVSGEEISRALGVSRTAVWKQIRLLRELGYDIEAVPSRGYRLNASPDALLPEEIQAELGTAVVGRKVLYFDEVDSTNVRAFELGEAGAPDGTVVVADRQTAGKGRLGRRWASPGGVNFYASVLLRPPILPRQAPQLTFVSALAAACAVTEVSGLDARVKWPNDLLLHGRKVAGLLNEMSAEFERIHFVVLGIGVNLNMRVEQFPPELRYPATSVVLEKGEPVSRLVFARAFCRRLDELYRRYLAEGFEPIRRGWQERCDLFGGRVQVDQASRILEGIAVGIDEDGALLVRLDDGTVEKVLAGDVRPL